MASRVDEPETLGGVLFDEQKSPVTLDDGGHRDAWGPTREAGLGWARGLEGGRHHGVAVSNEGGLAWEASKMVHSRKIDGDFGTF